MSWYKSQQQQHSNWKVKIVCKFLTSQQLFKVHLFEKQHFKHWTNERTNDWTNEWMNLERITIVNFWKLLFSFIFFRIPFYFVACNGVVFVLLFLFVLWHIFRCNYKSLFSSACLIHTALCESWTSSCINKFLVNLNSFTCATCTFLFYFTEKKKIILN